MKTSNIAFYDDALLIDSGKYIIPILEEVNNRGLKVKIHLPNGIHARLITRRVANVFHSSGVDNIRIGLETADKRLQRMTGAKTTNRSYLQAVRYLREAGYKRESIGTYIIAGLPGQGAEDVEKSIHFVHDAGAAPYLSYFSPIPGTAIWQEALEASPFPIDSEPLFQNNSVYLLGNKEFSSERVQLLKDMAVELRNTT